MTSSPDPNNDPIPQAYEAEFGPGPAPEHSVQAMHERLGLQPWDPHSPYAQEWADMIETLPSDDEG